jgi:4-aminobutyrate aminotransferase-like enzyme
MIMDEVQTGFGRVGTSFWAHKLNDSGFVPDILTIGKVSYRFIRRVYCKFQPIGNGFPVACVVTRKAIADKLGGQVGYFNTFGGNPVSCAAILAVLEVLKLDRLVEHSDEMNEHFDRELKQLQDKHSCIGDVRGVGMFWGLDLVKDRQTREPATQLALDLCMMLKREYGVLLNADGPHTNILKYKPPMCFNLDDLRFSVRAIDSALTRLTAS